MIFFLVFISTAAVLFYEFYWKRRNLPPGPTPLPLLGNLVSVVKCSPGYECFREWRKEYGPVYTYWLGPQPMVVVADYQTMKESIIKDGDKFADRATLKDLVDLLKGGNYGVINSWGDIWREQRRFVLHTLRDFGMGKNLMEERVMLEVDFLIDRMRSLKTDLNMQSEFDTAVGSIINNILFGYRFDESKLHEFKIIKGHLRTLITGGQNIPFLVATLLPVFRKVPYFKEYFFNLINAHQQIMDFIAAQIEERRKEVDFSSDEYTDFVECYLKEQRRQKGKPNESFYCDHQLTNVALDIWAAGMETTSNTLTWTICYVLNHPNVQKKMHEELDRVIGSDRMITMGDKNDLPYVNAVVNEAQRVANLLPQNLQRKLLEDTVIGAHPIKAGTVVMPQISTVLYDERVFPDPYTFKPERFINSDGSLKRYEELVPFSVGKRQCVGEGLAKVELFLFVANLFQRFKFSATQTPSMVKNRGQVVTAKDYLSVFHELYWKKRNLPPGPTPLPVLGNLLSFSGPQQYEIFRKWKNEFGPVYTIWLSFQPMVVISDYAVLKETILKQGGLLADRFSFTGLQRFLRGGGYGLIFSNGDLWREQRRFAIHTLRDFGMGRNLMEERIMEKLHEELDRVIGSVRKVTTADKNSLPYLNAVVNESQRLANILPQNLQRVLVEDAVVGGYTLKAGTAVMPQISTVMLDEKIFPDPYTFNPSRFLNPDGSSKKIEELIPFSMGKRQCIGEGLARAELYLFLANIFQRFTLTADVMPSMEKAKGQVVTAKKYLCNVAERH
ncbi:unnamed protein product, partial [Mesorhabditis spiculigera]